MLSDRLKLETRAAHDQIEGSLGILMSPALTREAYAELVARFYGFYAGWEDRAAAALADAPTLLATFNGRRKRPQLAADLRALGWDAVQIETLDVASPADLPPTATRFDVLGTMYVLEGSTLGGQVISKRLEAQLGVSDGVGYGYFRGAGPQTMPRWREFRTLLDTQVEPAHEQAVIDAASETFRKLRGWLTATPAVQATA